MNKNFLLGICIAVFALGYYIVVRKSIEHRYQFTHEPLHEFEKVAVPEYYRAVIGYDSLQVTWFMNKREVNFCNPNKYNKHH